MSSHRGSAAPGGTGLTVVQSLAQTLPDTESRVEAPVRASESAGSGIMEPGPKPIPLTCFDYQAMTEVMEKMCIKKIAYGYSLLRMVPKARELVFDALVPFVPLRDFDLLEQVAKRELDEYFRTRQIENGPEQMKPILRELKRLWEAERGLREKLEQLRNDQRFLVNGFYEGCVRLVKLDSHKSGKMSVKYAGGRDFLDKDVSRVLKRLEFFWTEVVDPNELPSSLGAKLVENGTKDQGIWNFFRQFFPST